MEATFKIQNSLALPTNWTALTPFRKVITTKERGLVIHTGKYGHDIKMFKWGISYVYFDG